jgi:hypothetical protein
MVMSARTETPRIPSTPTVSPRTTARMMGTSVLDSSTTRVVLAAPLPVRLPVICAPVATISTAMSVSVPSRNSAVVNPPMPRASGAKFPNRTPSASGISIMPPGTRAMDRNMGTLETSPRNDCAIATPTNIGTYDSYVAFLADRMPRVKPG